METDMRRKLDTLFDRLEKGEIGRAEFVEALSSIIQQMIRPGPDIPSKPDSKYVPPKNPRNAGVLIRIVDVDENQRNMIEGVVKPGALPFWQRLSEGEWRQYIVSGTAVVDIDGKRHTLQAGENITIQPRRQFTFINEGNKPWRFKAYHPVWQPERFSYGVRNTEIAGDDVWFALRPSPDDTAARPAYRILPARNGGNGSRSADPLATDSIAWVPEGAEMMRQMDTAGRGRIRMLQGEAEL